MPRIPRTKSKTGLYHVMIRGNEKKNIFRDSEDKDRFLEILYYKRQNGEFTLLAFCLMDNHVHLAIGEGTNDIAKVMKKITVSYVYYFNKKYKRVGHLFQDRFKSQVIESDSYLLSLIRYIHYNPIKSGLVNTVGEYRWSSYNSYITEKSNFPNLIDKQIIFMMLSNDPQKAKQLFIDYMSKETQENFMDLTAEENVIDEKAARLLYMNMLEEKKYKFIDPIPLNILQEVVSQLQAVTGLSIRQIAFITGINKNKVSRILRKHSKLQGD
ncbi:MAG: transposase [Peptococcaceae bacterium]|nr:transposase [Peptococcaceae bacterium]